jgi:hypothetical protein
MPTANYASSFRDVSSRPEMTNVTISSKANGMSTLEIDVGDIRPISVAFTADELVVTLAGWPQDPRPRWRGIHGCGLPVPRCADASS